MSQEVLALKGVVHIPASDEEGRMDDDLFDLLLEEETCKCYGCTTMRKKCVHNEDN